MPHHISFYAMKNISVSFNITVKTESELTDAELELVRAAKEATFRSYSPYSNFRVGAAALLADGIVVTGSNQENCAYPSGTCAERTTVFYANSQYPDTPITTLCIAARDTTGEFTARPIAPCGSCRQVLIESEKRGGSPMRIILYGTQQCYIVDSALHLLPIQFDQSFLG